MLSQFPPGAGVFDQSTFWVGHNLIQNLKGSNWEKRIKYVYCGGYRNTSFLLWFQIYAL